MSPDFSYKHDLVSIDGVSNGCMRQNRRNCWRHLQGSDVGRYFWSSFSVECSSTVDVERTFCNSPHFGETKAVFSQCLLQSTKQSFSLVLFRSPMGILIASSPSIVGSNSPFLSWPASKKESTQGGSRKRSDSVICIFYVWENIK